MKVENGFNEINSVGNIATVGSLWQKKFVLIEVVVGTCSYFFKHRNISVATILFHSAHGKCKLKSVCWIQYVKLKICHFKQ